MDYRDPIASWKQYGNVCFWRFEAQEYYKFAGWHFNGDEAGCDSLLALLSAAAEKGEVVRRTVMLASSRSAHQSRVVGLGRNLRVACPEKLRFVYSPEERQYCSLNEEAGVLTMTLGPESLREFSGSVSRVRAHDGDFAIGCDSNLHKRGALFFWWWLNG
ncbi:MAG TPA: hypothetical protein VN175_04450 [Rhizomicrobium sp.]|nr:hypothetical protein [Rhizomicrobium sp.]